MKEKVISLKMRVLTLVFLLAFFGPYAVSASDYVRAAQAILNQLGYSSGAADGIAGKNTFKAIGAFYADQGKKFDGKIDYNEVRDLWEKFTLKKRGKKFIANSQYHLETLSKKDESRLSLVNEGDRIRIKYPGSLANLKDRKNYLNEKKIGNICKHVFSRKHDLRNFGENKQK